MAKRKDSGYVAFSLKCRPQQFDEVVGQSETSQTLRNEIASGRVNHAYIFSGPRGVGKTSMARIFAKAINCVQGPTPTPCGDCEHCHGITIGSDLDVIEIDGASNTGIDDVRALRETVHLNPFACRYKVYIIDEVHMLSVPAFNALLKTLEEPPRFVVFIFATTEFEKIPETIRSRCQVFHFKRIATPEIMERLEEILSSEGLDLPAEEATAILEAVASSADGSMRDAQVALDQLISLTGGRLTLDEVQRFLGVAEHEVLLRTVEMLHRRETEGLLRLVGELIDRGRNLERFVRSIVAFLRELMILKAGGGEELTELSGETLEQAKGLAGEIPYPTLMNFISLFIQLEEQLKTAIQSRFLLEFTLVKATAIEPVVDIAQLLASGASPTPPPPAPSRRTVPKEEVSFPAPEADEKEGYNFFQPPPEDLGALEEREETASLGDAPEMSPAERKPPDPPTQESEEGPCPLTDLEGIWRRLVAGVKRERGDLLICLEGGRIQKIARRDVYIALPRDEHFQQNQRRLGDAGARSLLERLLRRITEQTLKVKIMSLMGSPGSPSPKTTASSSREASTPPDDDPPARKARSRQEDLSHDSERLESDEDKAPGEKETLSGEATLTEEQTQAAVREFLKNNRSYAEKVGDLLDGSPGLKEKVDMVKRLFNGKLVDPEGRKIES